MCGCWGRCFASRKDTRNHWPVLRRYRHQQGSSGGSAADSPRWSSASTLDFSRSSEQEQRDSNQHLQLGFKYAAVLLLRRQKRTRHAINPEEKMWVKSLHFKHRDFLKPLPLSRFLRSSSIYLSISISMFIFKWIWPFWRLLLHL